MVPEKPSLKPLEAALMDAEERAKCYPDTFHIPPVSVRMAGQVGFLAKIGLEDGEDGERFWVEIVEVREDGSYIGRIDNDLGGRWNVNYNDLIAFQPKHILDVN